MSALVAATLILGAGASAAIAAPTAECLDAFDTLRDDATAAQGIFANEKSFTSAIAKLDAAADKLAAGKDADAAVKVGDFADLLTALASGPKPKITDPEAAQVLVGQAEAVEACLAPVTAP
ncbi:MAG TPA: hypothetical protein VFN76_10505 [Candidatus Limnocylindria bacterium]|nr:hypothetical protein [Candidatus Limnocylindria bacterium]